MSTLHSEPFNPGADATLFGGDLFNSMRYVLQADNNYIVRASGGVTGGYGESRANAVQGLRCDDAALNSILDQFSEASCGADSGTIDDTADNYYGGVACRIPVGAPATTTVRDCYWLACVGQTQLRLSRMVSGTSTTLATYTIPSALTRPSIVRLRLEATGVGATVTLNGYLSGTMQITYADTDTARLVTGRPGLIGRQSFSSNTHLVDDAIFGDVSGGSTPLLLLGASRGHGR